MKTLILQPMITITIMDTHIHIVTVTAILTMITITQATPTTTWTLITPMDIMTIMIIHILLPPPVIAMHGVSHNLLWNGSELSSIGLNL